MKSCLSLIALPLAALLAFPSCEKKTASTDAKPTTTNVATIEAGEWCAEHGVPESVCTRCNSKLIAGFKQSGDWCKEHELPKSQCITCDPALAEKFAAMAPKK